jgi:hypothetical protein
MGEFAERISDQSEMKIGTCEEMFYLRFEDRAKVAALRGGVDVNNPEHAGTLLFRLPFRDEDGVLPGDYKELFRRLRLYNAHSEEYKIPGLVDGPGVMQVHHQPSGLLLNVPCYHGLKLPEVGPGVQAFWNGKGHALELAFLRCIFEDCRLFLLPVVQCRFCRRCWRRLWSDVFDYIPQPMQDRLKVYAPHGMRRELEQLDTPATTYASTEQATA